MIAKTAHRHTDGERRKLEAQLLLEAHRKVCVNRGRRAVLQTLLFCGTATADDVRELVKLPPGVNPTLFGTIPGSLARAGIICRAGFVQTCRPPVHARPVSVLELADRQAAEDWLRSHPDERDPVPPGTQLLLFNQEENPTVAAAGSHVNPHSNRSLI